MPDKNICHVFEKPAAYAHSGMKDKIPPESVDFYGCTFDSSKENFWFHKHDDGVWYQYGQPTGLIDLPFTKDFGFAPDRFIGTDYDAEKNFGKAAKGNARPDGYVYYIPGIKTKDGAIRVNLPHLIGAAHHAVYAGADMHESTVSVLEILGALEPVFHGTLSMTIHAAARGVGVITNDYQWNPVRRLANEAGMSIQRFAEYFGIPYRTVQNWTYGTNAAPEWALPLFELRLSTDGLI